jgi:hypothetical protein
LALSARLHSRLAPILLDHGRDPSSPGPAMVQFARRFFDVALATLIFTVLT